MNTADLTSRRLKIVDADSMESLGRPWLFVHAVRTAFLICILLVSILYQIHLGNFISTGIWLPVYGVLLSNFFLNAIYLFYFDKFEGKVFWNALLFGLDTLAITLLIYFTGTAQSLFLFLYLVDLVLAGLVFSQEGAWLMTLWTSICFSALLIISPDISGEGLYFSITVNNIAFVAMTLLSRRLNLQLATVGSQLKETHSDLLVLQNLNELVVNNITNGLVVITRTGFVQYFNPIASEQLGAKDFQQLKIQDALPELGWPWETLVTDESKMFERREIRIERKPGIAKDIEVVAARFREADGKLKGWLLVLDDRTDQKRMEDTLRQKEKLAAVGQLAAGIAHEIRNPLASISGSIQLMLSNPQSHSEEDMKLMRIVDKEIDRLNGLISEFLDYVRPEQRVSTPINLNALVQEVLEGVKFNASLRQDVKQEAQLRAACQISGNRDKLKQALLNLFINAYQAMLKTEGPVLHVETQDQRDMVVLIVRDNGVGIKKENLHRIFEPFHTTKPNGTGLGLAVTHKILEAHEARTFVESVEGQGTRFLIEFPAHRDFHTEDLIPLKREAGG